MKTGRKKNKECSVNENISFASSSQSQKELRSVRVPCFPLERLLSIFTSIFSKYGDLSVVSESEKTSQCINLRDVGSIMFFESLANVRHLGFLLEVSSSVNIVNSISVKYVCNLSRSDAIDISTYVQFPLSEYLT